MGDGLVAYAASEGSDDETVKPSSLFPTASRSYEVIERQSSIPSSNPELSETKSVDNPTDPPSLALADNPSPATDQVRGEEIDSTLVNKLAKFKSLREQGIYFNDNLVKNKSYRNPHIYTKLVQFVNVQETGTNFPPEIWNPLGFQPEAFADALREKQQSLSDAKQLAKSHSKRTEIEFEKGSSSRKAMRVSENEGRIGLDHGGDRDRAQRDKDRERDRRRGGSRSPQWRK